MYKGINHFSGHFNVYPIKVTKDKQSILKIA